MGEVGDREALPREVEDAFADFWQAIVAPNGTLDRDMVLRELYDYKTLLDNVPVVYCHVTGGRISKPNTLASAVTSEADAHYERMEAEDRDEAIADALIEAGVLFPHPPDPPTSYMRVEQYPPWLKTDDDTIDTIVDGENVVLMQAMIYKLKAERDAAVDEVVLLSGRAHAMAVTLDLGDEERLPEVGDPRQP